MIVYSELYARLLLQFQLFILDYKISWALE